MKAENGRSLFWTDPTILERLDSWISKTGQFSVRIAAPTSCIRRPTNPGMPSAGLRTTRSAAVIVVRSEKLDSRVAVAEGEDTVSAAAAAAAAAVDHAARNSRLSAIPVASRRPCLSSPSRADPCIAGTVTDRGKVNGPCGASAVRNVSVLPRLRRSSTIFWNCPWLATLIWDRIPRFRNGGLFCQTPGQTRNT